MSYSRSDNTAFSEHFFGALRPYCIVWTDAVHFAGVEIECAMSLCCIYATDFGYVIIQICHEAVSFPSFQCKVLTAVKVSDHHNMVSYML